MVDVLSALLLINFDRPILYWSIVKKSRYCHVKCIIIAQLEKFKRASNTVTLINHLCNWLTRIVCERSAYQVHYQGILIGFSKKNLCVWGGVWVVVCVCGGCMCDICFTVYFFEKGVQQWLRIYCGWYIL